MATNYRLKVKQVSLTAVEFNNILKAHEGKFINRYKPNDEDAVSGDSFLWEDNKNNLHFVVKDVRAKSNKVGYSKKVMHYVVDLYSGEVKTTKNNVGAIAIKKLNKYAKQFDETYEYPLNSKYLKYKVDQFTWTNRKIERNKWIDHCYGYDVNSCYPKFMTYPLPNKEIGKERIVGDNEIGFRFCDPNLELSLTGEYADIIFTTKKYKCFEAYANEMFNLKQSKKDDEEKYNEVKVVLNALMGDMKYHNIFIRAAVLGYATRFIKQFITEDTIMSTVDSIYSLTERTDLPLGIDLGQFRCEHFDEPFIFASNGCKKWLNEESSVKGIKKSKFDDNGDIYNEAKYHYDHWLNKLIENKNRSTKAIWPKYQVK